MASITDSLFEVISRAELGDLEYIKDFIGKLAAIHHKAVRVAVNDRDILEKAMSEINGLVKELERILISVSYLREATLRSRDYILSFGEKLSTAIVCAAFQNQKFEAHWFTGGEAGIITDDNFGDAKPLMNITTQQVKEKINPLIEETQIPIITGYIARTQDNVTTTLGRGGSDYSATIIARALDFDEVWLWKDTDGIMTADPKIEPMATTIPIVSFSEAIEMAYFGAKVIHPKSLEPVLEQQIKVRIKNTFNPNGLDTIIEKYPWTNTDKIVKSIVMIRDVAMVTVSGTEMIGMPGIAAKVFGILGENKINILMISQSSSEANISFIVPRGDLKNIVTMLESALLGSVVKNIYSEADICVVAVVGAGMKGIPGVAAKVFKAVANEGINVRMIAQGSSELNISFVVGEENDVRTVRALHKEFQMDKFNRSVSLI
jgi:aspartate kinase